MGKSRGRTRLSKKGRGDKGPKKGKKGAGKIPVRQKTVEPEASVPVVCSECFGDFLLSTKTDKDRVTCPSCGHVGIIEDDTFVTVARARQNHKKSFIAALAVNVAAVLCFVVYGLANSWPFAAQKTPAGVYSVSAGDETMNMALLGLGGVLLLAGLFLVPRYERSRVEVYF
jgi:hypothetical protein